MKRLVLLVLFALVVTMLVPLTAAGNEGRPDGATPPQAPTAAPEDGVTAAEPPPGGDLDVPLDQVILDDLIVDGSACVGQDCVNGESFGFDTIRIKENNLRISAIDTSSTASFPSNDWQLTFNDSTNGGQNKFSIDDLTNSRTPFTIEAAAPSHSLYVDDGGRLGLGTNTPVVDAHIVTGNTPTLRLEQDGSSGFTPQTWDVAGNEANFFVRDATNGSQLPFQIKPGADSGALFIAANNDVGLGTQSPQAALHVRRTGATGLLTLLRLEGGDGPQAKFVGSSGVEWRFGMNNASQFGISVAGSGVNELVIDDGTGAVTIEGDLTVNGTFSNPSDVNRKRNFATVDTGEILAQLASLDITTWTYDHEGDAVRHIGPTAQDFYGAFGLGTRTTHIAVVDQLGVAYAAIQGLNDIVADLEARVAELEAALAAAPQG